MKKAEFLKLVKAELNTIKKKATPKEIDKLDFESFNHDRSGSCIYGQMTGYCSNSRAREIMNKKYSFLVGWRHGTNYEPFSNQSYNKGNNLTALEKYLYMVRSNKHKQIIEYLKGERKTIKL